MMKRIGLVCLVVLAGVTSSFAQQEASGDGSRRGLITSAPCPYSCRDAGIPVDMCRESRVGNVCQVEDLSQPAGHRSMFRVRATEYVPQPVVATGESGLGRAQMQGEQRGLVTSSVCPYTCRMAGVPKDFCREWNDGETCYVEDLSQPAGHRSRIPLN